MKNPIFHYLKSKKKFQTTQTALVRTKKNTKLTLKTLQYVGTEGGRETSVVARQSGPGVGGQVVVGRVRARESDLGVVGDRSRGSPRTLRDVCDRRAIW